MGSVNLLRATEPAAAAKPDPELEAALKDFHMEGPKGWSYTQTTVAAGQKRVEHYDGGQPEFSRWSLIEQDGRPPTADELEDYMEKNSRRSRGGTAPRLTDQLDMRTLRVVDQNQERTTYRCRLKPAETGDATGKYLEAALVLHRATRTIESFTLEATEPFSPTLGVKIQEMVTVMRYSLPQSDVPSLLQTSITRLRGTAFFFKSLDADRTVTFTDYHRARPQRSQSTVAPASSP
jgi:hypothetical protein